MTKSRIELEKYDFTVKYIKGRDNVAADAFSLINMKDLKIANDAEDKTI